MNDNRYVCCGQVIPEGRQVCPVCEQKANCQDRIDYWMNEWVFPLIVLGVVIAALVGMVSLA